jgi:DNA-binding CsgD family transcriptional regulator
VHDLPDDLGAGQLGSFTWDVERDHWTWSDAEYLIYGYRPGEVEPTFDLAIRHKLPAGRARAEQALAGAVTPGFRFSNHHQIVDTRGRTRVVVSLGATTAVPSLDGRTTRPVVHGYMVDITDQQGTVVTALAEADGIARSLSRRERQVLVLLGAGLSNSEIAERLFVSLHTVKTYLRTSYRKIGVARRSQAVLWVMANQRLLADPPRADELL